MYCGIWDLWRRYWGKFWAHCGGQCEEGLIINESIHGVIEEQQVMEKEQPRESKVCFKLTIMMTLMSERQYIYLNSSHITRQLIQLNQMNTAVQSRPKKLLLLTSQLITREGLVQLAQQLESLRNPDIQLLAGSYEKDDEIDLKLSLLVGKVSMEVNEKWVACCEQDWKCGVAGVRDGYKGIFVIADGQVWRGNGGGEVFWVRSVRECVKIISMTEHELENRKKMEKLLERSNLKYQNSRSFDNIRSLAQNLVKNSIKASIKQVSKYLGFYGRQRVKKLRRYFTKWNIWYYEAMINNKEQEIIQGDYLIDRSNRRLTTKCFNGWKECYMEKQALRAQSKF